MIFVVFIILLSLSMLFVGLYFIIGTVKGVPFLVNPSPKYRILYPYKYLMNQGQKAVAVYHIFCGITCIIFSGLVLFTLYYYW